MRNRLSALALAAGLMLVSCSGALTPSQVTPGSDKDGIELRTQFPVYAPDVPFIQFSISNHSGETAECDCHETGSNENNRHTLERLRNVVTF